MMSKWYCLIRNCSRTGCFLSINCMYCMYHHTSVTSITSSLATVGTSTAGLLELSREKSKESGEKTRSCIPSLHTEKPVETLLTNSKVFECFAVCSVEPWSMASEDQLAEMFEICWDVNRLAALQYHGKRGMKTKSVQLSVVCAIRKDGSTSPNQLKTGIWLVKSEAIVLSVIVRNVWWEMGKMKGPEQEFTIRR